MSTAYEVAFWLEELGAAAEAEVQHAVEFHGQLLQTAVKRHASGRPGPNIVTGDYNRSIGLIVTSTAEGHQALVGTDKVQGRRLEMGFKGEDAAGRVYDQPPYPHFGPAMDEIKPGFEEAILAAGTPLP